MSADSSTLMVGASGATHDSWPAPPNTESHRERIAHSTVVDHHLTNGSNVYVPNPRLFSALDDFCNPTLMDEARAPLVITGAPGIGRSALLANWVKRRKKFQDLNESAVKEFLFYHFAGCSQSSAQIRHLLFRCMTELRDFFGLR